MTLIATFTSRISRAGPAARRARCGVRSGPRRRPLDVAGVAEGAHRLVPLRLVAKERLADAARAAVVVGVDEPRRDARPVAGIGGVAHRVVDVHAFDLDHVDGRTGLAGAACSSALHVVAYVLIVVAPALSRRNGPCGASPAVGQAALAPKEGQTPAATRRQVARRARGRGDSRGHARTPVAAPRGPGHRRDHARISCTTRAGSTPVSRASSPRCLCVNRSWSMPNRCRMVAWKSRMCTGSLTMLYEKSSVSP